jgi:antirestriction protein
MTVTLTSNYQEVLSTKTVEKIDELLQESYELTDMLEFIDQHNETDFVSYYEEYVRCGEEIGYEAVDALIEEIGDVSYVEGCDERYRGVYESKADFAEQFITDVYGSIPDFVVVDWERTYDYHLHYDHTACEVGYLQVHIFSDN